MTAQANRVDLGWMRDAACQGMTSLFFSDDPDDVAEAVEACASCLVMAQCVDWRDRTRPRHGVWAGQVRGLGRRFCGRGHHLVGDNLFIDVKGSSVCLACRRDWKVNRATAEQAARDAERAATHA